MLVEWDRHVLIEFDMHKYSYKCPYANKLHTCKLNAP